MRRSRESSARGHGTPPLVVKEVEPVSATQYPTVRRGRKRARGKAARPVSIIVEPGAKVEIK